MLPQGARANIKVLSARSIDGADGKPKLEVVVENTGSSHSILDQPTLTVSSGAVTKKLDAAALSGSLAQENVLAQHQRRFYVAWPDGLPKGPLTADLSFSVQR